MTEKNNDILKNQVIITATSFLDEEEKSGNRGFKTKSFEEQMKSIGWKYGQSWCAYFIELVWRTSFTSCGMPEIYQQSLNSLFSGSVVQTFRNFKNSKLFEITKTPSKGCLVLWQSRKNPTFGHCGIVISFTSNNLKTIEGNTNSNGSREGYKVCRKSRTYSPAGYKLLGFVNLPDFCPETVKQNENFSLKVH